MSRERRLAWLLVAAAGCAELQSADDDELLDPGDDEEQGTDPITGDAAEDEEDLSDGSDEGSGSDADGSDGLETDADGDSDANADGETDADGDADADDSDDGDPPIGDPDWEPAGNTACGTVPPSGDTASIESVEDGNAQITLADDRLGYWFSYRDEADTTGAVDAPAAVDDGANGTMKALKVGGKSAMSAAFGPGFGFSVYSVGGGESALNCPYDASAYAGVSFYIRGTGVTSVQLAVLSEKTVTRAEGGTCMSNCDDHFGKAIAVTSSWAKVTVKWSELAQAGWGTATTFEPSRIAGFAWTVEPGKTFDLRVDEVEFTR
jgi:hypothetical protein